VSFSEISLPDISKSELRCLQRSAQVSMMALRRRNGILHSPYEFQDAAFVFRRFYIHFGVWDYEGLRRRSTRRGGILTLS